MPATGEDPEFTALCKRLLAEVPAANKGALEAQIASLETLIVDLDAIETFTVNAGGNRISPATFDKFASFCKANCEKRPETKAKRPKYAGSTSIATGTSSSSTSRAATGDFLVAKDTAANGTATAGGASKSSNVVRLPATNAGGEELPSSQAVPTPSRGGTQHNSPSGQKSHASAVIAKAMAVSVKRKTHLKGLSSALAAQKIEGIETKAKLHAQLACEFPTKLPAIVEMDYPKRKDVPYTFLDVDPEKRALATNARLEEMETLLRLRIAEDDENVQEGAVGEEAHVSQEKSLVGRVLCDDDGAGITQAKLNESSLLLEGSRKSGAHRIYFFTSDCAKVSTFPGQIIYAVGRGEKDRFHANRFIPGVPVPPRELPSPTSAPVHILAASGPFTKRGEMDYSPLRAVLQHALAVKPQMVVLMGPFMDANNNAVREGSIAEPDGKDTDIWDVIEGALLPLLLDFVRKMREAECEVLIVPSPEEAMYLHATPQPAYPSVFLLPCWNLLAEAGAHLAPNPCYLRVNNDVTISITSQDPLTPLVRSLLVRPEPESGGRLEEVMRHLLWQRSWFPRDGVERGMTANVTTHVDIMRRQRFEFIRKIDAKGEVVQHDSDDIHEQDYIKMQMSKVAAGKGKKARVEEEKPPEEENFDIEDCIPDVLLFCSTAGRGFQANLVEGRLFANPGQACKAQQTGTFCELFLHPGTKELGRVEIRKIPETVMGGSK
ncbi:unnamed protein product [Amoebophrya sp. A25]|nr:unnamed protein product [Amoebophrya sp. A25]|eukprot:GSA25T00007894001.1